MDCLRCSSATPPDTLFCPTCGARVQVVCGVCRTLNIAASRFCGNCGHVLVTLDDSPSPVTSTPRAYTPEHLGAKILASRAALEGEHKQVTVLFCDIADSTRIAAEIGPEAMHVLLNAFFELAMTEVHRYDGTINQFLGDGFMALFGAPIAHEGHARLAVLAALGIQDRLANPGLGTGRARVAVRIGLNTGPVVVGKIGDDRRMDYTASGETTHLAARFQQHAEAGTILISEATRRFVAGYVEVDEVPCFAVKHLDKPMRAFKAVGLGKRRTRLDMCEHAHAPFVGRSRELEALEQIFSETEVGHGRAVGIAAEAGAGKSRLLYEFRQAIRRRPVTYVEAGCVSYGAAIPYLPLQELVRGFCGIEDRDSSAEIRARVRAALARVGVDSLDHTPFILQLLGAEVQTGPGSPRDPEFVRARIFETLSKVALNASRNTPLIVAIEDAHWIDKGSGEFFAYLVESMVKFPILLIMTYRDDYQPPWLGAPHASQIALGPLSADESASVVAMAARGSNIERSTFHAIIAKAEGNPFFLEELTQTVLEHGASDAATVVPDTIQEVLMARIDRLPSDTKRVLQTAAVLGREFPLELLKATCAEGDELSPHLALLRRLHFLNELVGVERTHAFRHALMQETCYDSLLTGQRKRMHEAAGAALEAEIAPSATGGQSSASHGAVLDLLAYHYSRSGNRAKEAHYCELAGDAAVRKGAYIDALNYVRQAVAIVCAAPISAGQESRELMLRLSLGAILLVVRGQGSSEAKAEYDAARVLCRVMAPAPELGRALFGIWTYYLFQGLMGQAEEIVREIVALANLADDHGVKIMARLAASQTYLWMGKWTECLEHTDEVFRLYRPEQHAAYITQYAQNPKFTALGSSFWALWALGYADRSMAVVRAGIEDARNLNHDFTFVMAYLCLPLLFYHQRDIAAVAETIDELRVRAQRAGNPFYIGLAQSLCGWLASIQGDHDGVRQILEQRKVMQLAGSKLAEPLIVTVLADAYLRTGQYAKGLEVLDQSGDGFVSNAHLSCLSEHRRLRGELLLALGDVDAAEVSLQGAIDAARGQRAKALELRAALSLARLQNDRQRREEARDTLTPVFNWFAEGMEAPDMREAAALLRAL